MNRFWWKCRRIQNEYKGVTIPWPDTNVAASLCKDGHIIYHIKQELSLSDGWILKHVSPNITSVYGTKVGSLFGHVLYWRVFDPKGSYVLPRLMVQKVRRLYSIRKNNLRSTKNLIAKIPLVIECVDAKLSIQESLLQDDNDDYGNNDNNNDDNADGNKDGLELSAEERSFQQRKFKYDNDRVFFAHSYPYTFSDLNEYLDYLEKDDMRCQNCHISILSKTLAGNNCK